MATGAIATPKRIPEYGRYWVRTSDPLRVKQVLSQLS